MQGPCLTEARIWASLLVRYTDCTVHMYVVFVGFTGVVRDEWYSILVHKPAVPPELNDIL